MADEEYQQNLRTRYQENGNWARHYSTVRMSVTPFLVGLSLGIVSFQWKPDVNPPLHFVALGGVVWIAAVLLFLLFTRLTYGEMERARAKRVLMPIASTPEGSGEDHSDGRVAPHSDGASWVVGVVTVAYGFVLYLLAANQSGAGAAASLALRFAAYAAAVCVIAIGGLALLWTCLQPNVGPAAPRTHIQQRGAKAFGTSLLAIFLIIVLVLAGQSLIGSWPVPSTFPTRHFGLNNVDPRSLQGFERDLSRWATEEPVERAWGTIVSPAQIDHSTTLYQGTRVQLVGPRGRYYYVVRYQGATYELPNWQLRGW